MAEINNSPGNGHSKRRGVRKSKKLSTRIDLTPMVDLGFLLITFFIFTTTMSDPTAMKVFLPDDPGQDTPVKASGALTLMPGKNNIVYYYEGRFAPDKAALLFTTFKGLREIIINKKKSVNADDFVVIIKPHQESVYKNTVDALDEMTINAVKHYSMGEINAVEEEAIRMSSNKKEQ